MRMHLMYTCHEVFVFPCATAVASLSEGPLIRTCYDLDTRSHKELSFGALFLCCLDALWTSVATIAIEIGSGALHDPRKDLGGGPF